MQISAPDRPAASARPRAAAAVGVSAVKNGFIPAHHTDCYIIIYYDHGHSLDNTNFRILFLANSS